MINVFRILTSITRYNRNEVKFFKIYLEKIFIKFCIEKLGTFFRVAVKKYY